MLDVSQQTSALPQSAVTSKDAVRPPRAGQLARPKQPATSRRAKAAAVTEAPAAPLRTPAKRDRLVLTGLPVGFRSRIRVRGAIRLLPRMHRTAE